MSTENESSDSHILMSTHTQASPNPSTSADIWERTGWLWTLFFYITLFVPAALALLDGDLTPADRSRIVWLTLFLAVWHSALLVYTRIDTQCRTRPFPIAVLLYAVVTIIVWTMLVIIHPAFYFLLFSLYGQFYSLLRLTYAVPLTIILTLMAGYTQVYDGQLWPEITPTNPILWLYVLMAAAGVMFSLWINAIIQQSTRRRELIDELQRTRAELAESERNAGVLAERQRLAREIHDTLAQGFTSIVMNLEAAEQALPEDTTTAAHHIDQSRQIARASLAQARRVVADLRPELLEQDPLPKAIERVVQRWSEQTGIVTTAVTSGESVQLHPQVEVTLLRAAQEALANIRKHAGATEACVTLTYFGDSVMLDVQDNGVGLGNGATSGDLDGGFGLTAMRERVEMLHGRVEIESVPEEGTTLVVQIPIGERG